MGEALKTACIVAVVFTLISVIAQSLLSGWRGGDIVHRVIGILTLSAMVVGLYGEADVIIDAVKNLGVENGIKDNSDTIVSNILTDAEKRILQWEIPSIEEKIRGSALDITNNNCEVIVRCVITPQGYNLSPMRIYITLRCYGTPPSDTDKESIIKMAAQIGMLKDEDINITVIGT